MVNNRLKKVCSEWGVKFVATYKMTIRAGKPVTELYADGLHLTELGVKRVRQFFCMRLSEMGNKPLNARESSIYLKRWQWNKNMSNWVTY
jgi:hypothetical protein